VSREPIRAAGNVWLVPVPETLRLDTFHGLARAVGKIPFDARRGGALSYQLECVEEHGGVRYARIKALPRQDPALWTTSSQEPARE
jgi:hypothetical protein